MGKRRGGRNVGDRDEPQYRDWKCPINACAYVNHGWRSRCRLCEAHPSPARLLRGDGKGNGGPKALAQKQLEAERTAKASDKQAEKLKKRVAELEKKLEETSSEGKVDVVEEEPEKDKEDVARELDTERKRLARLKELFDEGHEYVVATDARIKSLVEKRDAQRPPRAKIRVPDGRVDKYQRTVDAKKQQLEAIDARIVELVNERGGKQLQLESARRELDDAKQARALELQKAIDESKVGSGAKDGGVATANAISVIKEQALLRLPQDWRADDVGRQLDEALGKLCSALSLLPALPSTGGEGREAGSASEPPAHTPAATSAGAVRTVEAIVAPAGAGAVTAASENAEGAGQPIQSPLAADPLGGEALDGARQGQPQHTEATNQGGNRVDEDMESIFSDWSDTDEKELSMGMEEIAGETQQQRDVRFAKLLADKWSRRRKEKAKKKQAVAAKKTKGAAVSVGQKSKV